MKRWEEVDRLYHAALEVEANDRLRFLEQECGGDAELRAEVESLLATHERAGGFLEKPAMEEVAQELKDELPTLPGRQLGPYRVMGLIGAGGMGEVYRAKDTRLNRTVAIKVLPPSLAEQPERRQRFDREARAIAGLSHPHICALYDVGSQDGVDFLVMEYLEGERLSQRLKNGPLPLGQLLEVAIQVAGALEQAHRKGVIHRDVKPGNIMLTEEGAKLLDFGLAKKQQTGLAQKPADAATESESLTEPGMVIGTVEYMAPEQVEGKEADARTDIFALGTVMYEMATGRKAFEGKSQASLMAAILNSQPLPMTRIRPKTPPALEHAVQRCLAKDPDERWQSMKDLAGELQWIAQGLRRLRMLRLQHMPVVLASLVTIAVAGGTIWWMKKSRGPESASIPHRVTWDTGLTTEPALSPDGRFLAYASDRSGEGNLDIWLQQLAGAELRGEPVRLTRNPADDSEPTFSPDGSQIAFRSARDGGGVYLIPTTGGQDRLLVKAGRSARFSPDGRSVAYTVGDWWLTTPCRSYILPLSGGSPRQLQTDFFTVTCPIWSPDGTHLLFVGARKYNLGEDLDWWVIPVEGGAAVEAGFRRIWQGKSAMPIPSQWTCRGKIIYLVWGWDVNPNQYWEISISTTTYRILGSPRRLTQGTESQQGFSMAAGHFAFSAMTKSANIWALPVDHKKGSVAGEVCALTQDSTVNGTPSVSSDGTKLAYTSLRTGSGKGLIKDLQSGVVRPILPEMPEQAIVYCPKLSDDGSMVAYDLQSGSKRGIYVANTIDLTSRLLCEDCGIPGGWFRDGSKLLLYDVPPDWKRIGSIQVNSGERATLIQYSHALLAPQLSPDGRWIAFHTNLDTREAPIMIVPLRNGMTAEEREWVKVTDGKPLDELPNWSPDGNLLYFLSNRDGFCCIWAQRLEPASKRPLGPAFAVYHSHDRRRSIKNVSFEYIGLSLSRDQLVFPMCELEGNIWMAEYREQP
jgi:serine/threonine protein kinase/Tol biopolymer transport system component